MKKTCFMFFIKFKKNMFFVFLKNVFFCVFNVVFLLLLKQKRTKLQNDMMT